MPQKPVNPLDKKVPVSYSLSRRTIYAYRELCDELDISASLMVEGMIKNFIKQNSKTKD